MENSLKSIFCLLACPAFVIALVEEPQVAAGTAVFEQPDPYTQNIRAADKTAINCKKFNIGKDETVHFIQDSPKDRVLCRVTGKEASIIEGTLKADGRLFIVNPQSIYFRETAKVDAHSLVASTLNIKDEDFVKGNYRFFLEGKDSVIMNKGQITANQDVVLMAPQIMNHAVIKASLGKVALLGGELITLNFEGDNLISFAIDEPLQKGFIEQAGKIEGAQEVLLKLRVADEMIRRVVNVDGLEPATKMQFENGKVYLVAGSSISGPAIQAEAPLLETAGDFAGSQKIELTGDRGLSWHGGFINGKLNSADAALNAPQGLLEINAPIGKNKDDKVTVKTLSATGKIVDQNAFIKTGGAISYSGDMILISGDTHALNSSITYNGPVVVDGDNVKINSGRSKGNIKFNSTLDADTPSRNLTISNGSESGTVAFNEPIGSKGSFSQMAVKTGKAVFVNIGDRNRPGAEKLVVEAPNVELLGSVAHAKEQIWDVPNLYVKSGQHTTFIAGEKPLKFSSMTHISLSPQTNVAFETQGGAFEFAKLSGDNQQSVSVSTGHGDSKIGELSGKLGPLHVESQNIYMTGEICVGTISTIFMEACDNIGYAADSQGKTEKYALRSEGEVTLNAKDGMIGAKEFPMTVESSGKLYLGAKSYAYVDGFFAHNFPYVYKENPPPRIVYKGNETQYVFNEEIFMEEEDIMSLTPDLFHIIPYGFVDAGHFAFRRAAIYFTRGDSKIGDSTDEASGELAEAED